jgi:hypothetical protein
VDDDDDDDDYDDDEVDDWDKPEEEDDWDPDFEEFDLPKSKVKKAGGKRVKMMMTIWALMMNSKTSICLTTPDLMMKRTIFNECLYPFTLQRM